MRDDGGDDAQDELSRLDPHSALPRPQAWEPPDFDDLVDDLKLVRRRGVTKLRRLEIPALEQALRACGRVEPDETPAPDSVRRLLSDAVAAMGMGEMGTAASYLFGLMPDQYAVEPSQLRKSAAEVYGISVDTWRKGREVDVIEQVAELILGFAADWRLRLSRLDLERRVPTDTRLAVDWHQRFEGYYGIWNSLSGLERDLDAVYAAIHASTLDEPISFGNYDPDDGDPLDVADLQAQHALFHYAEFSTRLRIFEQRHGGLWLATGRENEELLADAVLAVRSLAPTSERDDSAMRIAYDKADGELHLFLRYLGQEEVGQSIYADWVDWIEECDCAWRDRPDGDCKPHIVIQQCRVYQRVVDEEWERVRDWR